MCNSHAYIGYFNENGNLQGIVQVTNGQAVIVGYRKLTCKKTSYGGHVLNDAKTGKTLHLLDIVEARKIKGLKPLTNKDFEHYFFN